MDSRGFAKFRSSSSFNTLLFIWQSIYLLVFS